MKFRTVKPRCLENSSNKVDSDGDRFLAFEVLEVLLAGDEDTIVVLVITRRVADSSGKREQGE
eukprot:1312076-Amphidinium_carterae.1